MRSVFFSASGPVKFNPDSLIRFLETTLGPPRPGDFYQRIEKLCKDRRLTEARVRSLAKEIAGSRLWRKRTYFAHCIETELKPLVPEVEEMVNSLVEKMAVKY